MAENKLDAAASGTFRIGGDLEVNRLGFGAMRITGKGIWGPPQDREECIRVLRRTVEVGINLIDTADSYGPFVSEELIAEALHPYPRGLVIATKGGLERPGPDQWTPNGHPKHLRATCEASLKRLKVDVIDLWQLHRIDPEIPAEDQIGTLADLRREGKIRHVGLSEVTVEEIEAARREVPIVTVQNRYNVADREWESVLDYCEKESIGFIPWFPLGVGKLAESGGPLADAARRLETTPSAVALAWLLRRSPVMLPIPGTSKVKHLDENVAASALRLTDEEFQAIADASAPDA
ncbi:aldo/keto reductase [Longimicrobium terrae]|uniref:Aryl-alcohol dehydrogenase-like predicted oxidoreductase n=1 Tax=Longimicrobium terrae TaxID=1639882 RepID=A0A841GSL5_9BACT|nr:aldo/keto reductase [Longimicrobium terrae]MBB4634985.1 aryl-alcohol dehydrogenase-like predicted oxidoreductase [Longimicrobium terrae]MBB6069379.1 aryl-alcohol dehydrogenase-like predicted oxidoreductase [Longimicrobium terrae]NNC31815.1 aldo/keto reductase [Longimicrobium terrae]